MSEKKDNPRYYWLRLTKQFLHDKITKKMRSLPNGDSLLVIYELMLVETVGDNGVWFFDCLEEDFSAEVALVLGEDLDLVKQTIDFLMKYGLLVEKSEGEFFLVATECMTGSETASTQRSRKSREKQKMLQCNTDATQMQHDCNTETEIKLEEKTYIESNKECSAFDSVSCLASLTLDYLQEFNVTKKCNLTAPGVESFHLLLHAEKGLYLGRPIEGYEGLQKSMRYYANTLDHFHIKNQAPVTIEPAPEPVNTEPVEPAQLPDQDDDGGWTEPEELRAKYCL